MSWEAASAAGSGTGAGAAKAMVAMMEAAMMLENCILKVEVVSYEKKLKIKWKVRIVDYWEWRSNEEVLDDNEMGGK